MRRIELSKIHSNLSSRYARYRIKGKESFPGKLSRETSPPAPNFLSSTSTELGARFLRGKKNTRADIYRNPSVLTFEWSSNRVLGQRTRVSSAPRNSFIEKGVFSPWLTCRTRKEEERMRERERERRGASWLSETLALLPATVSTGETRSNGIKKPLRDRDCSRLTVSHPSPYLVRVTPLDSTSQIAPPQRQWWLCYRSPRHS